MAGLERVYVAGHVEIYHATPDCDALLAALQRTSATVLWCWAAAAHRSRLMPCSSCTRALTTTLRAELGSVPSGARRSMGLPVLESLASALRGRGQPALQSAGHEPMGALRPVAGPAGTARSAMRAVARSDRRTRAAEIEDFLNRALDTAHADLEAGVTGWADPAAS